MPASNRLNLLISLARCIALQLLVCFFLCVYLVRSQSDLTNLFGCLFIVSLDLQYSVFKVRHVRNGSSAANAGHNRLLWAFAPQRTLSVIRKHGCLSQWA